MGKDEKKPDVGQIRVRRQRRDRDTKEERRPENPNRRELPGREDAGIEDES